VRRLVVPDFILHGQQVNVTVRSIATASQSRRPSDSGSPSASTSGRSPRQVAGGIYEANHSYMDDVPLTNLVHHGLCYLGQLMGAITWRHPLIRLLEHDETRYEGDETVSPRSTVARTLSTKLVYKEVSGSVTVNRHENRHHCLNQQDHSSLAKRGIARQRRLHVGVDFLAGETNFGV